MQDEFKSNAASLAQKREEVKKLKGIITQVERERDNKEIMIKQLKIEMENYAEELLTSQEKEAILEQTVQ